MENQATEVGKILKTRRIELHKTMEEIAEKCGVNKSTVSRWESGFIKDLKRNNISALCEILRIPTEVLFGGNPAEMIPSEIVLTQNEIIDKVKAIGNLEVLQKISEIVDVIK